MFDIFGNFKGWLCGDLKFLPSDFGSKAVAFNSAAFCPRVSRVGRVDGVRLHVQQLQAALF